MTPGSVVENSNWVAPVWPSAAKPVSRSDGKLVTGNNRKR